MDKGTIELHHAASSSQTHADETEIYKYLLYTLVPGTKVDKEWKTLWDKRPSLILAVSSGNRLLSGGYQRVPESVHFTAVSSGQKMSILEWTFCFLGGHSVDKGTIELHHAASSSQTHTDETETPKKTKRYPLANSPHTQGEMEFEIALAHHAQALSGVKRKSVDSGEHQAAPKPILQVLAASEVHDRLIAAAKRGIHALGTDGRTVDALHRHSALFVAKTAVSAFVAVVLLLEAPVGELWPHLLACCVQNCCASALGHSHNIRNKDRNHREAHAAIVDSIASGPTKPNETELVNAARAWARNGPIFSFDNVQSTIDAHNTAKIAMKAAIAPSVWSRQLFEQIV